MRVTDNSIRPGDTVRFREPVDEAEADARFVVREINEVTQRAHIRLICDLPIPPIEVVELDALMLAAA